MAKGTLNATYVGRNAHWFVFFAHDPDSNLIKIGKSHKQKPYIKRLESKKSCDILVSFRMRSIGDMVLKRRFAMYKMAGDWFENVPAIQELITLLQEATK